MKPTVRSFLAAPLMASLISAVLTPVAFAQEASAPAAPADAKSGTVTEDLIRLLQQRKALSADEADALIAKLRASQPAAQPTASAPAAAQPQASEAAPGPDKGKIRVMYIPESEKEDLRREIRQEVMEQAQNENWAQPAALPDWIKHITLDGDFRFRQEFDLFDRNNDLYLVNFQAINSGNPFDENGSTLPPTINTRQNRELPRFRARLGLRAEIAEDLITAFRFTSGNNTNPVSTNQTLGTDFNKTTFVIDRAYLEYRPSEDFSAWLGRMPNPWASTPLVWDDDLNFDGIAARYVYRITPFIKPFLTVGAFSIENTAFDFPSTTPYKIGSRDKWLFASQLGIDWKFNRRLKMRGAVAFYDFYHLEGAISSPCLATTTSDSCDTDNSRPGFLQKGNTLMELRDLLVSSSDPNGPVYQYFGLASPFRELDANARIDYRLYDDEDIHLIVDFDYVQNLAYNATDVYRRASQIGSGPVNNYGTDNSYEGGSRGFLAQVMVGYPKISEALDWSVTGGYRRLETDAVVDAFTDSDFHLGGTNAKGYYVQGELGFTHHAWFTLRYLSAEEVSGSPLSIDVVQLDVNARF